MVMLTFLFYHMEGFTCRVRLMHSSAITMARSLGIHKIDIPTNQPQTPERADIIDREIRRKVWWHLTSTDWILSLVGGSQEGTYTIQPQSMHVNVPRNLNQADLDTQGPDFSHDLSEPTCMAYYLQRIKLATICRDITDTLWHSIRFTDPTLTPYPIVSALDSKLETQLLELPRFMRLDISYAQLRAEYGKLFTPALDTQRIMIQLMIHSRRCQMHMPFLIRAQTNPQFQQSRALGLQSARAVFETRRFAVHDAESFGAIHLKLGGLLQHIFYATIALVMDLCINRALPGPGANVAEVREALAILAESAESSQMGARFHESLNHILRKHNVAVPQPVAEPVPPQPPLQSQPLLPTPTVGMPAQAPLPVPGDGTTGEMLALDTTIPDLPSHALELDGLWQEFLDSAPILDYRDWDALISDFDLRAM